MDLAARPFPGKMGVDPVQRVPRSMKMRTPGACPPALLDGSVVMTMHYIVKGPMGKGRAIVDGEEVCELRPVRTRYHSLFSARRCTPSVATSGRWALL